MNWYKENNFLGFALFFHHLPLDEDDEYKNGFHDIRKWALKISYDD